MSIEKRIKQLKALKQYKGKSEEELREIASRQEEKVKVDWSGLDRIEKKWADKRFNEYKERFHIESYSDLQLLEELVKREALQERHWKRLGKISEKAKKAGETFVIPKELNYGLNQNLEQILILKEKLGLFEEKSQLEWVKFWKSLIKKIDKYVNSGENGVVAHIKCGYCGRVFLARKNIKDFETLPHPFFTDRNIIYNKHLFDLLDQKKITSEDVAKILNTTPQFIEKLYKEKYLKEKNVNRETKQE